MDDAEIGPAKSVSIVDDSKVMRNMPAGFFSKGLNM
jgi:hypothetical protein